MSVCEILPNLWLGNIKIASTSAFYINHNINCVINCSKDIEFFDKKCNNIRISVNDDLKKKEIDNLLLYLDKSSDLIYEQLINNNCILVHCYAGIQRSASVILAYLIKYANVSLYEGVQLIQSKRFQAFTPGINFLNTLQKYEKSISVNKNL